MAQTLYASFADASLAEKAAGALLDHGVRNEDISLISREPMGDYDAKTEKRDYTTHTATIDERRAGYAGGTAVAEPENTANANVEDGTDRTYDATTAPEPANRDWSRDTYREW